MSAAPPLEHWVLALESALDVPGPTDARAILDLVREVAHRLERPAGPLAAYLAGVAVGSGSRTFDEAVATIEAALPAGSG